ncbi:hypothetical protein [Fibrobacter sp. UWH4]|uniref:hypothetical protein n=1 Tax=Fibrobacter sp. UWH4 TaxID=1896210 RepID=UPI0009194FB0|nr:hypothetical protein [Fibrobacter sp. UWH4]SHL08883.1 hypothetical protein SAMN05720762_104161 [Fibrobacter sp. UWH4]
MGTETFDLIKPFGNGENHVDYGFVFGGDRQKVLLIKAGQGGSIYGYRNKYLKLACEMRELCGFSVVCASTPSSDISQMAQFAEVVKSEFEIGGHTQIYFMGMSMGASIGCIGRSLFPEISRFLLVNPPLMINTTRICRSAKAFDGDMMTFVFGSLDPSAHLAGLLKLHECENMHVVVVPGQDHHFSRNEFRLIELMKLLNSEDKLK